MPTYPTNQEPNFGDPHVTTVRKQEKFPRYDSQESINTRQPTGAEAPKDPSYKTTQGLAEIGSQLQEIGLKFAIASDHQKAQEAELEFKTGVDNVLASAQNDPDPNNSEPHLTQIERLRQQSLNKKFNFGASRDEATAKMNYYANAASIQVGDVFRKKMIDKGRADMFGLMDSVTQTWGPESEKELDRILSENIEAGFTDYEEAQKLKKEYVRTSVELTIANDTSTDESQSHVLAELKKGDKGEYAGTSTEERLALIKASQQRIFNNNQTFKRDIEDSANVRSNALIDKFASGEATIEDIEAEKAIPEESGGIKRSQLLTYQRSVLSGIKGNLDRMLQEKTPDKEPTKRAQEVKKYLDLIDNFVDDKTDQWKAKEMLANAYEDGIVNSKEQKLLNGLKQSLKDIEFNRSTSLVTTAIKEVKDFLKVQSNASDEDIARNIKTLLGEISTGEEPGKAAKKIIQREVALRIPDLSSYPKTGKVKRDANGNKIRIFPDGTYEDEPSR